MENSYKEIDYERENQISQEFYNRGYTQGNLEGSLKLTEYLCGLTEEELIKWQKSNIALRDSIKKLPTELYEIIKAIKT